MSNPSRRLYQGIFLLCLTFVVARFIQIPAFGDSLLGFLLPCLCLIFSLYAAIMAHRVLKGQKIIEEKLDSLLQRSIINPSPLASVQHLSRN
jgi:hypothetical protein